MPLQKLWLPGLLFFVVTVRAFIFTLLQEEN